MICSPKPTPLLQFQGVTPNTKLYTDVDFEVVVVNPHIHACLEVSFHILK